MEEVPVVVEEGRRGGRRDLLDAAVQGVVAVGDHHVAVVRDGGQTVLAVPGVAPAVGKTVGHAVVLRLDAVDGVRYQGDTGVSKYHRFIPPLKLSACQSIPVGDQSGNLERPFSGYL